jgi:hypothetical protein
MMEEKSPLADSLDNLNEYLTKQDDKTALHLLSIVIKELNIVIKEFSSLFQANIEEMMKK